MTPMWVRAFPLRAAAAASTFSRARVHAPAWRGWAPGERVGEGPVGVRPPYMYLVPHTRDLIAPLVLGFAASVRFRG